MEDTRRSWARGGTMGDPAAVMDFFSRTRELVDKAVSFLESDDAARSPIQSSRTASLWTDARSSASTTRTTSTCGRSARCASGRSPTRRALPARGRGGPCPGARDGRRRGCPPHRLPPDGHANLHPADGALNLPQSATPTGCGACRRRGRTRLFRRGGRGDREGERPKARKAPGGTLARRAASDFDSFYEVRKPPSGDVDDALVLSADGKGIVMRTEALERRPPRRRVARRES